VKNKSFDFFVIKYFIFAYRFARLSVAAKWPRFEGTSATIGTAIGRALRRSSRETSKKESEIAANLKQLV
jgi:hypothetical protein